MTATLRDSFGPARAHAAATGGTIGIVLKGYPRLSETFVLREMTMLESLGLDLHVFAMRDPRERAVHDEVKRLAAHVTYLPDRLWAALGAVLGANARAHRRDPKTYRAALGFAVRKSLAEMRFATLKRFLQAAYLVELGLPGTGVGHLHAHFGHDPTTVAFFASWLSGLGYSFSAHAKDIYAQDPRWLAQKIARARFVVTCTEHNRRYLERLGGSASVRRAYHGVELARFVRDGRRERSGPWQILSVGRLVPKKGFSTLFEALARLAQRGVDFHCTVVGDGGLVHELRAEIQRLELEERIELVPPMPQSELLERYRESDLFALACEVESDGDRDGIPNVIVEALAMEVPVVSTRVSGIPECVEDGVSGFLVAERDPGALADAIARLIADPERARRFGSAGRLRVEAEFDAAQNIRAIEAALREALNGAEAGNGVAALDAAPTGDAAEERDDAPAPVAAEVRDAAHA